MSKMKKRLLNVFLGFIGFVLLVGILFFAIEPGMPTTQLNSEGVATSYLSLPNGRYSGDTVGGILSGQGTFEFDTGEIYKGSWENHNMSGKGTLTSTLGDYSGEFKDSQRSGNGVFTWSDGAEYDGAWSEDKMNGEGVLKSADGIVYTGTFINNVFSSGTVELDNDVAKYTLKITDGVPDNTISVVYDNGTTYEGGYLGDEISGEGVMVFPKKGTYEGNFRDGKRHGNGTFTWTNGVNYSGQWEDDLMDGYGTYTFKNGSYLKGTFKEGKLDGIFTYHNSDGDFSTTWNDGKCTRIVKS